MGPATLVSASTAVVSEREASRGPTTNSTGKTTDTPWFPWLLKTFGESQGESSWFLYCERNTPWKNSEPGGITHNGILWMMWGATSYRQEVSIDLQMELWFHIIRVLPIDLNKTQNKWWASLQMSNYVTRIWKTQPRKCADWVSLSIQRYLYFL